MTADPRAVEIIAAELARHTLGLGNTCACGRTAGVEDDLALPEWDQHLASASAAALTAAGWSLLPPIALLASEDTCRRLVHARLAYYGCTIDQITAAEQPRQHTDACERTEQGWHCYDEHDRSLHPLHDTLDEAAEQIRWVLDQIGTMLGGPNAPLTDATEQQDKK